MYVETSILAKLYLNEPESDSARRFVAGFYARPTCSVLGRMELFSTFHRKLRERALTQAEFNFLVGQYEQDIAARRIEWLPLSGGIMDLVQESYRKLSSTIFLRAIDAIHLATAAENGLKEIYSNDKHLLAAAPVFKLKGINPLVK
jgi:predicted nucleic acid-binding protein